MLIASFRNYTICISGNDPFAGDKGIAVEIASFRELETLLFL
jgi:hypothetical protein